MGRRAESSNARSNCSRYLDVHRVVRRQRCNADCRRIEHDELSVGVRRECPAAPRRARCSRRSRRRSRRCNPAAARADAGRGIATSPGLHDCRTRGCRARRSTAPQRAGIAPVRTDGLPRVPAVAPGTARAARIAGRTGILAVVVVADVDDEIRRRLGGCARDGRERPLRGVIARLEHAVVLLETAARIAGTDDALRVRLRQWQRSRADRHAPHGRRDRPCRRSDGKYRRLRVDRVASRRPQPAWSPAAHGRPSARRCDRTRSSDRRRRRLITRATARRSSASTTNAYSFAPAAGLPAMWRRRSALPR